jgi:hypothetical protein
MLETSPWAYVLVALGYQDSYPCRVDAGKDLTHGCWEVHGGGWRSHTDTSLFLIMKQQQRAF